MVKIKAIYNQNNIKNIVNNIHANKIKPLSNSQINKKLFDRFFINSIYSTNFIYTVIDHHLVDNFLY